MDLTTIAIAVLSFTVIAALGMAFAGGNGAQTKAVKRAHTLAQTSRTNDRQRSGRSGPAADPLTRRKQILSQLKEMDRRERKARLTLSAKLRQAGLTMTPRMFYVWSVAFGVAVGLVLLLLGRQPLIAMASAFGAGFGTPRWIIGFLAARRSKKFTAAFPDALDVLTRGIKSGLPVHDSLKIIGRESPAPLGPEFVRLVDSMGMGVTIDQALEQMYERMPTPELRFFSIVLAIQQKTGGNLGEALGNLSAVLRSRKLMKEKIKAMASEATASAMIIGSLPPGVLVLVSLSSPSYIQPMFTDPRGQLMLLGGALWMGAGIFVMKRMIAFKF
jgi:tight adherence protein B